MVLVWKAMKMILKSSDGTNCKCVKEDIPAIGSHKISMSFSIEMSDCRNGPR
jgi:hypothetical protein